MADLAEPLFATDAAPGSSLVHWRDRAYSRAEIADAADRLAATLRRMGAAPDSAVAALVPSTPLGVVMLFGIWRAGAVPAVLGAVPPDAVSDATAVREPPSDPAFEGLVAEVRPSVVVRPSLDEASLVPQVVVGTGAPRHYDDAVALVATTTDAAGSARSLLVTRDALRAKAESARGTLRETVVTLVPVALAGWPGVDAQLVAVAAGASMVLLEPGTVGAYADAVRRFGVESAMITPDIIEELVDDPTLASLEPLRYARCVTARPAPEAIRRFRAKFGATALGGYGRPELGGEVTGWTVGDAVLHGDVKLGSVGRAYAGVEVRIVGDDGRDAAPDEPGEVWVQSAFAMRGYVSDRLGIGPRFDDEGFLHTGDRGRVDRDGFLWIEETSARRDAGPRSGTVTPTG